MYKIIEQPKKRSNLRLRLGRLYYGLLRKRLWLKKRKYFAKDFQEKPLPYLYFSHKTILLRKLKDVDMWMQENKIINLKIAAKKLNGVLLRPGEVFSYWKLIGNPTKRKGYVEGMILKNGTFAPGIGGGLCQLSNLIFWMTIHTPLTVVERHRHGYDVFPDSNRTQPFGSGATCFYPHGDLMIQNNTEDTYQLIVHVGAEHLEGEWRVTSPPEYRYEVIERNHEMRGEDWGGYSRHNEIYQQQYDLDGRLLNDVLVVQNSAIMMYSPFLTTEKDDRSKYMGKILCYIYDGMADFEISLLLHRLKNTGKKEIVAISEDLRTLVAQSGLHYIADKKIEDVMELDNVEALVIPGGPINNNQNAICDIICEMINRNKLVAAICFAPQFLGRAGILSRFSYTTSCSAEKIQQLGCEDPFDRSNFINQRCVVDRNLITAQGYAFVDFAEAVCDYLEIFESDTQKYEQLGRVKELDGLTKEVEHGNHI